MATTTIRPLWKDYDEKDFKANSTEETYESIFEAYASKPPPIPLRTIASNTLVVGQEFVLLCLLVGRHRVALWEESGISTAEQQNRITVSVASISVAFFLVVMFNKTPGVSSSSSHQPRKTKLQHRFSDAIFIAVILRFLASVLKTLTASYSTDTVYALVVVSFLLHMVACDYSYANGILPITEREQKNHRLDPTKRPSFQGGTVGLTAVFFGTILLASRLENDISVYIFISSSVTIFGLYPSARHQVSINTRSSWTFGKRKESIILCGKRFPNSHLFYDQFSSSLYYSVTGCRCSNLVGPTGTTVGGGDPLFHLHHRTSLEVLAATIQSHTPWSVGYCPCPMI